MKNRNGVIVGGRTKEEGLGGVEGGEIDIVCDGGKSILKKRDEKYPRPSCFYV